MALNLFALGILIVAVIALCCAILFWKGVLAKKKLAINKPEEEPEEEQKVELYDEEELDSDEDQEENQEEEKALEIKEVDTTNYFL